MPFRQATGRIGMRRVCIDGDFAAETVAAALALAACHRRCRCFVTSLTTSGNDGGIVLRVRRCRPPCLWPDHPCHLHRHRRNRSRDRSGGWGVTNAATTSMASGLLQMRDLRAVDSAFTVSNVPALLVRRNALVVNMYTIKAIILTSKCFFFLNEGADGELLAMREWLCEGKRVSCATE